MAEYLYDDAETLRQVARILTLWSDQWEAVANQAQDREDVCPECGTPLCADCGDCCAFDYDDYPEEYDNQDIYDCEYDR